MVTSERLQAIEQSLYRLVEWVEASDYKAYDPGDGQMSFLRHLTFGNLTLERALTASVLRMPFNLRPLLGITPHTSTKGMGYMAWGYLRRFRSNAKADDAERAAYCLDWLMDHRSPGYENACWGNHFTFTTRAGRIPSLTPTIVWSSLIGQAFIEAHETLGDPHYLAIATSVGEWVLTLPREDTPSGTCLSYVPFRQSSIHNSNMLGAALLAKVGVAAGRDDMISVAKEAMLYSCSRQLSDGSWYYGEEEKYHWIDNFHTGYNLDSLKRYTDATGDDAFRDHLNRGYAYFKQTFVEADGRPGYTDRSTYPIDIQCAAQAIDTLTFFSDRDPHSLELAETVARWTIEHMQATDGHFFYRDLGWKKITTPMFHWGQATMFKALAHLVQKSIQSHAVDMARGANQ